MFRPTEPLPTIRPDGSIAKPYADAWYVETKDGEHWIEAHGLTIPLDAAQVAEAAGSMASFVAARVHYHLKTLTGLFTEFTYDDRWAAAVAAGAAKAVAA